MKGTAFILAVDKTSSLIKKGLIALKTMSPSLSGQCPTRTGGLWLRRPTLYPPELIAHRKDPLKSS